MITSKFFPPMAMMTEGIIAVPVRIYQKEAMVAIFADIPIHPQICYEVANAILDWLKPYPVTEVITIAGIMNDCAPKSARLPPAAKIPSIAVA